MQNSCLQRRMRLPIRQIFQVKRIESQDKKKRFFFKKMNQSEDSNTEKSITNPISARVAIARAEEMRWSFDSTMQQGNAQLEGKIITAQDAH